MTEETGLELQGQTRPISLQELFQPYGVELAELEAKANAIVVTDATQVSLMKEAREVRLAIAKKRCSVETLRKELKEDSLKRGQTIDGIAKTIKDKMSELEEKLKEQEEFAIRAEAQMKAKRETERLAIVRQYDADLTGYDFREMSDEQFNGIAEMLQNMKERKEQEEKDRIAKEELEELERAEEALRVQREQERLAEENKKLQEQLKAEQEAQEAIRKAEQAKQAELEAEIKRKDDEIKAEQQRQQAEVEAKAKARAEQEAKLKAEQEALLKAGDDEKVAVFIKALQGIAIPSLKDKARESFISNGVKNLIDTLQIK